MKNNMSRPIHLLKNVLLCSVVFIFLCPIIFGNPNTSLPFTLQKEPAITLGLSYNAGTIYDADNDGLEIIGGVVDLSVASSSIRADLNQSNLCTRWEVYSTAADTNHVTPVCYGSKSCCNSIGLLPARERWDEPLYLTYGQYGATHSTIVGAQIFDDGVYFSSWQGLPVIFVSPVRTEVSIQEATEKIEKIKHYNSGIKQIRLTAPLSFSVAGERESENIDITLELENKKIILENIDRALADWDDSGTLQILEKNSNLNAALSSKKISLLDMVTVKNALAFTRTHDYSGTVTFPKPPQVEGAEILYCPDDTITSCLVVIRCNPSKIIRPCRKETADSFIVYVPHFSTIAVVADNLTAQITILSPDNWSILEHGEDIFLNISSNVSIKLNESVDGQPPVFLGNGTQFSTLLAGTLSHGVFSNGQHTLVLGVEDTFGKNASIHHTFTVNDTTSPSFSVNLSNESSYSFQATLTIQLNASEYAQVSTKINNNNFSTPLDIGLQKSTLITISPQSGQNTLVINLSDYNGNSKIASYQFMLDTPQQSNCTDALQNGDETGIDCGGSCNGCIPFNISTNKPAYNLSDSIYLTVVARETSVVNMTVFRAGIVSSRLSFVPVFSGAPIAETRVLSNTSQSGNYTINATLYYRNTTQNILAFFEILPLPINTLTVSITANVTVVPEDSFVRFTSSVSGNVSATAFAWDFNTDGVIDNTTAEPLYHFITNGTYITNLSVKTTEANQSDTEIIIVKKRYNITFLTIDNITNGAIANAEITLDDFTQNTSSEGKVVFSVVEGAYDLAVHKQGYRAVSNTTTFTSNALFEIRLAQKDSTAPLITLLGPENNTRYDTAQLTFTYLVTDTSLSTCTLYTSRDNNFWKRESASYNILPAEQNAFILNVTEQEYFWKIECIDREGNKNTSVMRLVNISSVSIISEANNPEVQQNNSFTENSQIILAEIKNAESSLSGLGNIELEAAKELQLQKSLELARREIERANRDLNSLKWRKLNDTELAAEQQRILQKVEEVRQTTPRSLHVLDSSEFVKYPPKESVEAVLLIILNQSNKKYSKKEIASILAQNLKIQSQITLTTNYKLIDVEYLSGVQKTITLIHKKIPPGTATGGFYEYIPKEIAKDIDEITILSEYAVVARDPLIKMEIQKTGEVSYYFKKRLSRAQAELLHSVLIDASFQPIKKQGITGLSIFQAWYENFVTGSDIRLIIEISLIVVLALVFLYYQLGGGPQLMLLLTSGDQRKNFKELNYLRDKIESYLAENNYGQAKLIYKEMETLYRQITPQHRPKVYPMLLLLKNKMDYTFIATTIALAERHLAQNEKKKAMELYAQIRPFYKNVSVEYKSKIVAQCIELHKKLN